MARANGPIGYVEHRSPMKDEEGKYIVHPMFVKKDIFDFDKMAAHIEHHGSVVDKSLLLSALGKMEKETIEALADGSEVRLGDMFIIRPKLRVRHHKDDKGNDWKKTYHEGELIPANEVEVYGFDIVPTKNFMESFEMKYRGCSRQTWSVHVSGGDVETELAGVIEICHKQGYVTVKDMVRHFGVSQYHARKFLDDCCEGPASRLYATKEGTVKLYRLRPSDGAVSL